MTLSVDLFYSFRSPYSYLALPKITKMVADYDLAVNLRPVYPLAVRVPGFFTTSRSTRRASPSTRISPIAFPGPTRSCRTWRR